jgi:glycosyltransferase involved in cell wall biosynthesis
MIEVCFSSWRGYAGCLTSCSHAAAVLGGRAATIDDGAPPQDVIDAELLVLSSWAPAYDALLAERRGRTVGRWHSALLQTELSREGWKLSRLLELLGEGVLSGIACNDAATAAALDRPDVVYLPDVFDETRFATVRRAELDGVNVSLVGEPHGRKNLLVQSAGFERARRARNPDWTLHLFGQTVRRGGYARWLEHAGVSYVDHGFLPEMELLELIAGMDAGLCASISESYGYAAAEHVALGVPVIASRAVASLEPSALTAGDPSDPAELAALLERAIESRGLVVEQQAGLRRIAAANAERSRVSLTAVAAG